MHDNPEATEEEQELAQQRDRQQEEDDMRGPSHPDPDESRERVKDE